MDENQINAQFTALCNQRNAALNDVVNLSGQVASMQATIKTLSEQLDATKAIMEGMIEAQHAEVKPAEVAAYPVEAAS